MKHSHTQHFVIKRQFLKLVGAKIRTYDNHEQLLCFAQAKAFKLKEEIWFYADEAKTKPLFSMKARSIIDFGATYDITDANNQRLGSIRREGLKSSFVQDSWKILNAQDQEIGTVKEDSGTLGILRRYIDLIGLLVPQSYEVAFAEGPVAWLHQRRNPFTIVYDYNVSQAALQQYSQIWFLAIPNILGLIEARQN